MLRPSLSGDRVPGTLFTMDLRVVLSDYEVTAVPLPRPALALVWSEPVSPADDDLLPTFGGGALSVVDDYRITRVPKAS
jgi:hypothetical protein